MNFYVPLYMKPFLLAGVVLCACIPSIRVSAPKAMFPVMHEKIYLYPVIDSSSIELFQGWPAEKPLQDILRNNFRKINGALLVEFRRCEKYGLYEIVEDSLLSSVRVYFIIGRFQFKKDTLTFPVRMTARRTTDKTERSFPTYAAGKYRAKSRPRSDVHYLDILLADFRRHFPYRKMSGVFFRPRENNAGNP